MRLARWPRSAWLRWSNLSRRGATRMGGSGWWTTPICSSRRWPWHLPSARFRPTHGSSSLHSAEPERVLAATSLPCLLLGGDPGERSEELLAGWEAAMALPQVRGLVAGRSLLYPPDGDVAAASTGRWLWSGGRSERRPLPPRRHPRPTGPTRLRSTLIEAGWDYCGLRVLAFDWRADPHAPDRG